MTKALVHHSLLEVMLFAGVPYQAAMANLAQTVILVVTARWYRWIVVGIALHGLLYWLTGDDPHRLYKLWRYCSYAPYYGPR
jgi:type IV secretory pathway VirB3-like protein